MSPAKSLGSRPRGTVFIPTSYDIKCKIIITADDDTDYTIMDTYGGAAADNHTLSATVTRVVTEKLGSFSITLANDGGRFLRKFNGGETVKIYADRTDATTEIFRGRIDNVTYGLDSSDGFVIEIDGRNYPELVDKTITGSITGAGADEAIGSILYNDFSNVTLQFWNGNSWSTGTYDDGTQDVTWDPVAPTFPSTLINLTFQHKKGISIISEICKRVELDSYIEYDNGWKLRTFIQDSITNNDCGISYGTNLISLSEYGVDNTDIVNKSIVYGKTDGDNVLLLKTEENADAQDELWIKDKIFNQSQLLTMDEVQDKANFELAQGIDTTARGRAITVIMPELRPGDVIAVSVPYCNISDAHKVHRFTHNLGSNPTTSIELSKKIVGLSELFSEKENIYENITGISNPNDMKDSYTVYFDEDPSIMSHIKTKEDSGGLKLQDGEISGNATSEAITADYNVTECELRRTYNIDNLNEDLDTYEVRNNTDSEDNWETYTSTTFYSGITHTFVSVGNEVQFRVWLNRGTASDTSPAYGAIGVLYK